MKEELTGLGFKCISPDKGIWQHESGWRIQVISEKEWHLQNQEGTVIDYGLLGPANMRNRLIDDYGID